MTNVFDYLMWRGDLSLPASPFNDVDALILSALSYIRFDGIVEESMEKRISIGEMAERFLSRPQMEWKLRISEDEKLLRALQNSQRFQSMELCGYVDKRDLRTEKQFSAMTVLTEDGNVFAVFRGTDYSLVGWKENFNMCFMDDVPAQKDAAAYLAAVADAFPERALRVGGHSKGGNLAVYGAAMCPEDVQERIGVVYNFDGPGFRQPVLERTGYLNILPRLRTFLPQFSVVGMLLEQKGENIVIHSNEHGIMQHELYSWEVLGADFVRLESLEEKSWFLDSTMTLWLEGVSEEQREFFVETVYKAISTAHKDGEEEILVSPRIVFNALQALIGEDEATKRKMGDSMKLLLQAAKQTAAEYASLPGMGIGERRNQNEK